MPNKQPSTIGICIHKLYCFFRASEELSTHLNIVQYGLPFWPKMFVADFADTTILNRRWLEQYVDQLEQINFAGRHFKLGRPMTDQRPAIYVERNDYNNQKGHNYDRWVLSEYDRIYFWKDGHNLLSRQDYD